MRLSLLRRSLTDGRRALIGWSVGIALMVLFNMAFYPSIKDNPQFDDLLEQMPEALRSFVGSESITSPAGYLEAQFFVLIVPLLFLIFAISRGSDAIAGEEQRKTIDVLLAHPIPRRSVAIQKFGAMFFGTLALGILLLAVLWICTFPFDMDIGFLPLLQAVLGSTLLAISFGGVALLVGAATGRKGFAIALSSAAATLSYFLNSLAVSVDSLEAVRPLSPFYYGVGPSPVGDAPSLVDLTTLVAVTALLLAAAVAAFDRRDLAL